MPREAAPSLERLYSRISKRSSPVFSRRKFSASWITVYSTVPPPTVPGGTVLLDNRSHNERASFFPQALSQLLGKKTPFLLIFYLDELSRYADGDLARRVSTDLKANGSMDLR